MAVLSAVGAALGFAGAIAPGLFALASLAPTLLYVFWYSRNGRTPSPALQIGAVTADLDFRDLDGTAVRTTCYRDKGPYASRIRLDNYRFRPDPDQFMRVLAEFPTSTP